MNLLGSNGAFHMRLLLIGSEHRGSRRIQADGIIHRRHTRNNSASVIVVRAMTKTTLNTPLLHLKEKDRKPAFSRYVYCHNERERERVHVRYVYSHNELHHKSLR